MRRVIQPTKQQHVSEHLRMFKRAIHHHRARDASTQTEAAIARELFACAAAAGNSEHKRAHFIGLPALVLELAAQIPEAPGYAKLTSEFAMSTTFPIGMFRRLTHSGVLSWHKA